MRRILVLLFVSLLLFFAASPSIAEEGDKNKESSPELWTKIDAFYVDITFKGTADKFINKETFYDFTKSLLKDKFSDIPVINDKEAPAKEPAHIGDKEPSAKKPAHINIEVWTVREKYPVSLNVRLKVEAGEEKIFDKARMGFFTADKIEEMAKEVVGQFIKDFAAAFDKDRRDM